jgi:hypothetical protein
MERVMFSGEEIAATVQELGYTHVIWLPDSAMGPWEAALESCDACQLLRICREGEAWPIAAGLFLAGQRQVRRKTQRVAIAFTSKLQGVVANPGPGAVQLESWKIGNVVAGNQQVRWA